MSVSLEWVTPDAEKKIIRIARVSSDQSNEDVGLLRYLIRQKHWSPFDMVNICFCFDTQRDVSRQLIRHGSIKWQEFSQRYAEIPAIELPEMRLQADHNRQSSTNRTEEWDFLVGQQIRASEALYRAMLIAGVAKETARRVLPECSPTRIYGNGTLRSWIHYVEARNEDAQKEHRLLAQGVKEILLREFPVVTEALGWA